MFPEAPIIHKAGILFGRHFSIPVPHLYHRLLLFRAIATGIIPRGRGRVCHAQLESRNSTVCSNCISVTGEYLSIEGFSWKALPQRFARDVESLLGLKQCTKHANDAEKTS
jgi:hypothetical protein